MWLILITADCRASNPCKEKDPPDTSTWSCKTSATLTLSEIELTPAIICLGEFITASAQAEATAAIEKQTIYYKCKSNGTRTRGRAATVTSGYEITGPFTGSDSGTLVNFTPSQTGPGTVRMWATATIASACAVIPDNDEQTATYKVLQIAFTEPEIYQCWSAGGQYAASVNLTPESYDTSAITWTLATLEGDPSATINPTNGLVTFGPATGGKYTLRAEAKDLSTCYEEMTLYIIKVELNIWNGGSDLDNGQTTGPQGDQVPDADEETVGAYLLVNWDDDDGDGVMNADGTWSTLPVPDLTEDYVANEDNLAKLQPAVEPLLDTGIIELEVSGADAGKVKLWTQSTKGTQITLTSNKKTWNLASPTEKADFQTFMNDGYWIEGVDAGTAERGVTFTLRYKDGGGTEICNDVCKATVVMINLANAVYRDNTRWGIESRGHAALVYCFIGPLSKANLLDDTKYTVRHCPGSAYANPRSDPMEDVTGNPQATARGCFTNPNITYIQRLRILNAAEGIGIGTVTYTWDNLLAPIIGGANTWNGRLNTLGFMRCDSIVEVCYEINGVSVWGMERDPDNHTIHYECGIQSDEWDYNSIQRTWQHTPNQENDNLEEHNDVDIIGGWDDTLMPATQAGYVAPDRANTLFTRQDLCAPIGTKGGNP